MQMKMAKVLLLHFIGWFGWIAFALLNIFNIFSDKWYIVLPLFILACWWGIFMNDVAQRYREKN
jgi:hypothetical protein